MTGIPRGDLDPDLLRALREATMDAADDGVEFYLNSGWRSPECQNPHLQIPSPTIQRSVASVSRLDAWRRP